MSTIARIPELDADEREVYWSLQGVVRGLRELEVLLRARQAHQAATP